MFTDKLSQKLITFAVFPALAASCLLLISFVTLQTAQTQDLKREKFALAEHFIRSQAKEFAHPRSFADLAQPLLGIKPFKTASLYDLSGRRIATAGLPSSLSSSFAANLDTLEPHQWQSRGTTFRLVPITEHADELALGWILIEVDSALFSVLQHQTTVTVLVLAGITLATAIFFANKLRLLIIRPIRQLRERLGAILAGNIDQSIVLDENSGFHQLSLIMNELIARQKHDQEAMQSYLEEYTQELRETLETVEIQNIELDIARKNALKSSRAKSEFLANASHELRTPLNGIIGFSNLLLKTNLSNQQTDYLATIEQSAQGLLTIINDILDISRLETGQLTLEYKAVSIQQTIEDVLKLHAPSAHEKKLRLVTMIDSHVPENLLGDPQRLKQVVTNLVSNAIKFSETGTIVIRVNFIGETDNQVQIKFSVSDNGIGLTADQKANLFDSFGQGDTAENRLHGGTGLGLAIAKGLVQRMSGEIGVESEPGQGSTFWFTARLGLNNRNRAHSDTYNSLPHARVLVYDHDKLGRSEITHLLNNWNADYVETTSFNEVLHVATHQSPETPIQVAILDAQVSEQQVDRNSLRLCVEQLNEQAIPVIVLALPNICRLLEPELVDLQVDLLPRPISHRQLYRVVGKQIGITALPTLDHSASAPIRARKVKPARILAVDDNAANLRLVNELLKSLGTQVATASSGDEALILCASHRFDLILMDIQMPGMDGLETTRRLRKQEGKARRTPVVALTAHAVNEQKTRLLMAGLDDYLSKPVSDLELRHVIDRWVTPANDTPSSPLRPEPKRLEVMTKELPAFSLNESLERANRKHSLAQDMFSMLLASLNESVRAIRSAVQKRDTQALKETVHKLHGGCCYCGVPALRHITESLNRKLGKSHVDELSKDVELLLTRIDELQEWVEEQDLDTLFSSE